MLAETIETECIKIEILTGTQSMLCMFDNKEIIKNSNVILTSNLNKEMIRGQVRSPLP